MEIMSDLWQELRGYAGLNSKTVKESPMRNSIRNYLDTIRPNLYSISKDGGSVLIAKKNAKYFRDV